MRRPVPHAAPSGIDVSQDHVLPSPRLLPAKRNPPFVAGALDRSLESLGRRSYFFPFFAGFAGRGPGFAIFEGLPSEATSEK